MALVFSAEDPCLVILYFRRVLYPCPPSAVAEI
ncbi:predicted protein [Sclerotinia sclerotiorum 1980 UF-70]|uniref:Uncharacterized protein n=1 Tax=Sclerotinia sclerotiorum (strain ATCC 18683 / 1980 / Ss-1) TaxID=665079 RepID=A7ESD5_SCLS1|nr:predicted protein [Sclerotinia sclerotiorum 1980 UF-70]EDN92377.1 predicted protein [Sclerotinia sclerotiorum 1980 UF-70]